VPSDQQGLIGLCANQDESQLEVINFSEDVLDITPVPGTTLLSYTTYDVSSNPLPTLADDLEVEAQNSVVALSSPSAGAALLAVGGTIMAVSGNSPAQVYVGVDQAVSAKSFMAGAWTNYVMGIDPLAQPDDYYQAIADCVNSAYNTEQALQDPSPPPAWQLLYESLQTAEACAALQKKVNEYLQGQNEQENLVQELQSAGNNSDESDWVLQFEQEEPIQHEIVIDG
jgi:hypothetical protein